MPKTPIRDHTPGPGCSMRVCGQSPQPWPTIEKPRRLGEKPEPVVEYEADPRDCCSRCGGAAQHRPPCLNVGRDLPEPTAGKGCPGCPHPTPDMTCWRYPYPPCGSYDQAQAKPTPRAALGLTEAQRRALDAAAESRDYAELHHVVERLLADAVGPCGYDMGEGDTCLLPRNHGGQHS